MAMRTPRLLTVEGEVMTDAVWSEDYAGATKIGPFRVGNKGIYYRDMLKTYCVPLVDIDHVFTRVVATATHCCCGTMDLNTFRLVLCGRGKELAAIYTEEEGSIDRTQALLKERIPGLRVGYAKPEEG